MNQLRVKDATKCKITNRHRVSTRWSICPGRRQSGFDASRCRTRCCSGRLWSPGGICEPAALRCTPSPLLSRNESFWESVWEESEVIFVRTKPRPNAKQNSTPETLGYSDRERVVQQTEVFREYLGINTAYCYAWDKTAKSVHIPYVQEHLSWFHILQTVNNSLESGSFQITFPRTLRNTLQLQCY